MTGFPLIIAFVLAIVVMIVAISKYKIHPFLSIMSVSLILALTLLLSFPVAASAAELANVPTIDVSKTGSLTIYKYDLTNGATRS